MSQLFDNQERNLTKPPRRISIFLIPLVLLIVSVLIIFFFRGNLLATEKEVVAARAKMGAAQEVQSKGTTLFQAAGWLHGDLHPIRVTALVSGIVTKLYVDAGDEVKKGQLLIELNDEDLQLQLKMAQAELKELEVGKERLAFEILTEKAQLEQNIRYQNTAKAVVARMEYNAKVLTASQDAIPVFEKELARLEYLESMEKVKEFHAQVEVINSRIKTLQNDQLFAEAKIATQQVKIEQISLNLERTKISSPVNGIIQKLYSRVGRKQMLGSDNEYSATVAEIFDLNKMRLKVDVPLSVLAKVKPNQKAQIHMDFLEKPLAGKVTAFDGQADYQKNTQLVWVTLEETNELLRPEMIAQVEFISDGEVQTNQAPKSGVYIHKEALAGSQLWVIDLDSRITLRKVTVSTSALGDWFEVTEGLRPGEKAVVNPLPSFEEGMKVKVSELYE
jgi:HlyD family secretion protein